jgi:hypothetical protein
MPKIALVVAFSLAFAAPLAAQTRGGQDGNQSRGGAAQDSGNGGEGAIVATKATITPRPRAVPDTVTRTKQSFILPWFTGVYQ